MINKIDAFLKNYLGIIFIVLAFAITITFTLSYFRSSTERFNSALVYISPLEYDIKIDNQNINNVIVPVGKTNLVVSIDSLNDTNTLYKLLYQNNSNLVVKYKSNNTSTSGNIKRSINDINLVIENNSNTNQDFSLLVVGGYVTDEISNIVIPNGYTEINESISKPVNNCTYNGNLTQGVEYVNGQYTYRYMQEYYYNYSDRTFYWNNIDNDGWGVKLTDYSSTDPVTTPLCTSINGKPIVSMKLMFYGSKASSIDLSSFDTSNVTSMRLMFIENETKSLDFSSFDTSEVTDMNSMFYDSYVESLDLTTFDTSKVRNMGAIFSGCHASVIDLSSFDTSGITATSGSMFNSSYITTVYVGDKWDSSYFSFGTNMFTNATNLRGGAGTTWSPSNPDDETYAHADGGVSNPGYFTYKASN